MCVPGRSRFCLICLLLYVWMPFAEQTSTKQREATTIVNPSELPAPDSNVPAVPSQEDQTEIAYKIESKEFFITKIFDRYGNNGEITFEGFEHLLENLGLGKIVIMDHKTDDHRNGSDFVSFHKDHNHSEVVPSHHSDHCDHHDEPEHEDHEHQHAHESHELEDHDHNHEDHEHNHEDHEHNHEDHEHSHEHDDGHDHKRSLEDLAKLSECFSASVMLRLFDFDREGSLNKTMFMSLCPALIYQIDSNVCSRSKAHIPEQQTGEDHHHDDKHQHNHDHGHEHEHENVSQLYNSFDISNIPAHVWGYSAVAVVIISLVGLLGVAVIPIMRKVFYNHLLQFLVALAVGALSGDALLHLLPHAIEGGHGESHNHGDEGHDPSGVYKGLCGLGGIYFFFLVERLLTIFTDRKRKRKSKQKKKKRGSVSSSPEQIVGEKLANGDKECDEMVMIIHPNKALKGYADEAHREHCSISLENTTTISHQHGYRGNHNDETEEETMLSKNPDSSHSHTHHCHDNIPNSVSAIAWMVIFGDGIHNFSDGLAIGAAFASSTTGGFSTSIAVFCHELPHEIGDFAVLLRAGMSAKQAIIYNCVSSLLCFIGMLIGVCLGNISNASMWIFAIVGGMFLYIALVDMLPEMTAVDTKKGENPYCHLLLQCVGMLLGAGIMLLIAVYEEKLHNLLG